MKWGRAVASDGEVATPARRIISHCGTAVYVTQVCFIGQSRPGTPHMQTASTITGQLVLYGLHPLVWLT